jgi:hypothetical protein
MKNFNNIQIGDEFKSISCGNNLNYKEFPRKNEELSFEEICKILKEESIN